jgi:hypothetical protein
MGQLLPGKRPEWMGIHHHEQDTGPPSKSGFFIISARGSIGDRLPVCCVDSD